MTAQEIYNSYLAGWKWIDAYGNLAQYYYGAGYTPRMPPGFVISSPAGSTAFSFTGYGITTTNQDEAWDIYVRKNGGESILDSLIEKKDPPINKWSDMVDDMFKEEIDLPLIGKIKQWYILAGVVGVVIVYFFVVKKR